ncbi:hypothetical protein [Rubrolithibacter danxiaensis]|uniref:hypothetical protein n=1 Tax=Rubrolithibacter danxiaensis TaxID=3390805 RepID=UPI003BF87897
MRIHTDQEIIEKAASKVQNCSLAENNTADITVNFEDDKGLTHSYVVTFIKSENGSTQQWKASEINEISSL